MTMQLRPYQQAALDAIERGWSEFRRQIAVLPTGTGKTICFAHLAAQAVGRGQKVMILAHRDELLQQAQDKIRQAVGLDTALEKAESHAYGLFQEPITVASVQTLHSARLARWAPDAVDVLVVDEVHHAAAASYRTVMDHFSGARVLGVTATPDRADKRSLGELFENIAYEYSLRDAIQDGYLSPIVARLIPLEIDLGAVRTTAGDYHVGDLDSAIVPYLDAAAREIAAHVEGRQTLVFLPLVRTSETLAELLRRHGLSARHIDGASPDRAEILAEYADNKFQVLTNASLLLEGYDCPQISCVVCLRPTQSRILYAQCIGRGTRIAPGKENLLLLDFLWQSTKHNLCVPASLFAGSPEEARQAMEFLVPGDERDLLELENDAKSAREESLRRKLKEQRKKRTRTIDPLEFALSIHDVDLAEWEPTAAWHVLPATEKQLETIARFGFGCELVKSRGHASAILERVFNRRKAGLCTPKQAQVLERFGYNGNATMDEAKAILDELAHNGWTRARAN